MSSNWLFLVYRIPREPSAGRVFVWRKLQQLGAISLQDAIWVLPKTQRTQEQFQWLASEIKELKGESTLWEAQALFTADGSSLRQQFIDAVDREYHEVIAALKSKDRDLDILSKRFQDIQIKDHFASPLGKQAREKLLAAGGE
ncbi:MAG: hypothetical protein MUC43_18955 [Pirellula sp.]|nr:hypothetical protein [Pirellula sp.]